MNHILKKRYGPVQLLHVTHTDSLNSIMREGIRASKHGIFSVKENSGAGIYAIHNNSDALRTLIHRCFPQYILADLSVILFSYGGEFYECMRVFLSEEERARLDEDGFFDIASRVGHIVIPGKDAHVGTDQILGFAQAQAFIQQ